MKNRPEMPSEAPDPIAEIGEDELILHYYGESADPWPSRRRSRRAPTCASATPSWRATSPPPAPTTPEPPADLAARVWQELRPRLTARRSWSDRVLRAVGAIGAIGASRSDRAGWGPRWTLAAATLAVVAALGIGYLAGRPRDPSAAARGVRHRTLRRGPRAPAARLGREPPRGLRAPADPGHQRRPDRRHGARRRERLGRRAGLLQPALSRAAERAGQRRIVALLDELEPLLLELANSAEAAPDDLAAAQRRIEHTDLLFKLRVTGERLQRDAGASRAVSRTAHLNRFMRSLPMRSTKARSPLARLAASVLFAAVLASPVPASARYASAALFAADGEGRSPAYREAQSALDQARWEEAAQRFAAVADAKGADADAALYWKAYAEEKLGRKAEALQTLKSLRAALPEERLARRRRRARDRPHRQRAARLRSRTCDRRAADSRAGDRRTGRRRLRKLRRLRELCGGGPSALCPRRPHADGLGARPADPREDPGRRAARSRSSSAPSSSSRRATSRAPGPFWSTSRAPASLPSSRSRRCARWASPATRKTSARSPRSTGRRPRKRPAAPFSRRS